MRKLKTLLATSVVSMTALTLVACTSQRTASIECLAPYPIRNVAVVYPADGSSGVSTGVGVLVLQGYFSGPPPEFATLATKAGNTLIVAPVGPAPSPLPSPIATPQRVHGAPYGAVPIPSLSPQTTYEVQLTHATPCIPFFTDSSASFTTGSASRR